MMLSPRPIKSKQHDVLNRGRYVDEIYQRVFDAWDARRTVRIGVVGMQGCGKTSLLNLFREKIAQDCPEALIVEYKPNFSDASKISDGNVLNSIAISISGLLNCEKRSETAAKICGLLEEFKKTASAIAGGIVSVPGVAAATEAFITIANKKYNSEKIRPIDQLTAEINEAIQELEGPIILIIDDLDRLNFSQIEAFFQVICNRIDALDISCIIAFDANAVETIISNQFKDEEDASRQFNSLVMKLCTDRVEMKVGDRSQVQELFIRGLEEMEARVKLPELWSASPRFKDILNILVPPFIETPRDIIQIVKNFEYLIINVRNSVDWVDLLGYAVIDVKMGSCCELIEKNLEKIVLDSSQNGLVNGQKRPSSGIADDLFGKYIKFSNARQLLYFMFPRLSLHDQGVDSVERRQQLFDRVPRNSLSYRGALTVALGKGKPLGGYDDSFFVQFFVKEQQDRNKEILDALKYHKIEDLFVMVDSYLRRQRGLDPHIVIKSFAEFCSNQGGEKIKVYDYRCEYMGFMVDWFSNVVINKIFYSIDVERLVLKYFSRGNVNFSCHFIERQNRYYDIPADQRDGRAAPVNIGTARTLSKRIARELRTQFIEGRLFDRLYTAAPFYIMVRENCFDDECQRKLNEIINLENNRDVLSVLLCGGKFDVDGYYVWRMSSDFFGEFRNRVEFYARGPGSHDRHESVVSAYRRLYDRINEYVERQRKGYQGPLMQVDGAF